MTTHWVSNRGPKYVKAAQDRMGTPATKEEAEKIAFRLYEERKALRAQIEPLEAQMEDRLEDVRVLLDQYPSLKFYWSTANDNGRQGSDRPPTKVG